MALLRATASGTARAYPWVEAKEEADRIVAAARVRAEEVVAGASREAEAIVKGARATESEWRAKAEAEGRSAGEAAGLEAASAEFHRSLEAELAQARAALDAVAGGLRDVPAAVARRAEGDTVRLAVLVAEALVKRELKADPSIVAGNVRAAIKAITAPGRITLIVNPDDRALLEKRLPDLIPEIAGRLEIASDPSVARGGCRVRAEVAEADATWETQIQEIRRTLLGEDAG